MTIGLLSQSFPPKSKFQVSQIPSLAGKVCIVTGSNTGIGFETAKALLEHDAKVYVACRNEEKARAAMEALRKATGKDSVHFLSLDLGNIKASKAAAEEFMTKETSLHLLFNNAGVMAPPKGSITSDGYELQWGTNVLGHWIFTETLLPLLISTAATSPSGAVRIINTSSSAHLLAVKGGVDFEDVSRPTGFNLYGQSKLGNIVLSQYWAEKLKDNGIISVSLNPGNIRTELQRSMAGVVRGLMNATILHPVPLGALTQLYCGTSPEVTLNESGSYYVPWARLDTPGRDELRDQDFCKKVIELVQKQVQEKL